MIFVSFDNINMYILKVTKFECAIELSSLTLFTISAECGKIIVEVYLIVFGQ